ncbi:MAG: DUF2029 domain-containing protein [Chloroflexaceae bacterium]|nr:DUF2029 domain-containing protein [Chloroflexaceae bacterium]
MNLKIGLLWGFSVLSIALAAYIIADYTVFALFFIEATDFISYVLAAQRIGSGQPFYEVPVVFETPAPYIYPPLMAVVLVPFAGLPIELVFVGWTIFSIGCWVTAIALIVYALRQTLLPRLGQMGLPVLVAWLALFPALHQHLIYGQVQIQILLLLVGAWLLLRRQRDGWAGGLLGVAIAIKLFPALLVVCLPYSAACGRYC